MSYCRFSSNGFRSDVYVYLTVGGGNYQVHIADRRRGDLPPKYDHSNFDLESHARYSVIENVILETSREKNRWTELNHDFEDDYFSEANGCLNYLKEIKNSGLNVPERVINRLEQEID